MTKRPSPFEPSMCRQSKIHLNNYENDSVALKDMKERTLRKLLEGPKRLHSIELKNGNNFYSARSEMHSKNNFMQKLVTNYITVSGRKGDKSNGILMSISESPPCCFFCEAKTNSTYQCIHCLEFYCSHCSFVNYESLEDQRICLSCS